MAPISPVAHSESDSPEPTLTLTKECLQKAAWVARRSPYAAQLLQTFMGCLMVLFCIILLGVNSKRFDSIDGRSGSRSRATAATILMLMQVLFLSILVMATYHTFYCEDPVKWESWVKEWVWIGLVAGALTLSSLLSWLRLLVGVFVRNQADIPGPGPLLVFLLLGVTVWIPAGAVFGVALIFYLPYWILRCLFARKLLPFMSNLCTDPTEPAQEAVDELELQPLEPAPIYGDLRPSQREAIATEEPAAVALTRHNAEGLSYDGGGRLGAGLGAGLAVMSERSGPSISRPLSAVLVGGKHESDWPPDYAR